VIQPYSTGSATSTSPEASVWFCYACGWSGTLPAGTYHVCRPQR
jgi:hypothetical protein